MIWGSPVVRERLGVSVNGKPLVSKTRTGGSIPPTPADDPEGGGGLDRVSASGLLLFEKSHSGAYGPFLIKSLN